VTDHPTPLRVVFAVNTTPTVVVRAIHNLLDAATEPVTIVTNWTAKLKR